MSLIDTGQAVRVVNQGGVIAYPTEACFGIGCNPSDRTAVQRILHIKGRPAGMGFILISDRIEQLLPFLDVADQTTLREPLATWPGPFTWIFPAKPRVKNFAVNANLSVAVRVTAHPIAAQLCRVLGYPLVSTSANRHGALPLRSSTRVVQSFGNELDFVVRGAIGKQRRPTEIRDAKTGRVIRAG